MEATVTTNELKSKLDQKQVTVVETLAPERYREGHTSMITSKEDGHGLEDWLREIQEMQARSAAVRTTQVSATPSVRRVRPSTIGAFDA